ncbi:hypothetical protein NPD8_3948 (plasmid) [Clostridium botulinum]|uniref:Uncharacterized protein n=1 Tax=Clostridium botulinum TaxID=1491 RepID=A0A1L7JNI5_CLOBO|nr:hypothetical protein NPD8_3948 [Clostridium botulinum]
MVKTRLAFCRRKELIKVHRKICGNINCYSIQFKNNN